MELAAGGNDEDIPLITTLNFSAKEERNLINTRVQNKRLAQFFIKDIIKAKKYAKGHITEDEYYFEVFGVIFKKVHLRGTIVAIERMDMKLMFTVDDGTASIRCFVEERQALRDHKKYVEETLAKISKMKDKDSVINKGCVALLQGLQNRIKHFPSPKELHLGDIIDFIELLAMSNDNNHRYFVNVGYPNFFIGDLLKAEKIENHGTAHKREMFTSQDMLFKKVGIRGVITDVQSYNNKTRVIVDDCSGSICCIIDRESKLEEAERFFQKPPKASDFEVNKATCDLLDEMKDDLRRKTSDSFGLGNVVEIIGNFTEYNSQRYIFMHGLKVDDSGDVSNDVGYYNRVMHLYSTVYPKLVNEHKVKH